MKQAIFCNWNFTRIVRLLIGITILGQAVVVKDALFGTAGLFFAAMAIFNAGCCGTGSCYASPKKNAEAAKEATYEEVGS